jgi:drug/metabolite transporter (DMT)-like permease
MAGIRTPERLGVLFCLVAAAAFAVQPILTKLAYAGGVSVTGALSWRFLVAAPVLLFLGRRGLRSLGLRRAAAAFALGAALYAVECGLFFASLSRLDASIASLVVFGYPALVAAGAVVLGRERASRRRTVALGLALGGIALVLVGGGGAPLDAVGIVFAFGASVTYAAYVLSSDRLLRGADPVALAAIVCSGAAVSFGVLGGVTGEIGGGLSPTTVLLLVAIALGCTVLPIAAFFSGVVRLGPSRATVLATAEPPLTILFAAIAFGDRLTPLQLAGAGLVVGALVLVQLKRRPRLRAVEERPPAPQPAEPLAA